MPGFTGNGFTGFIGAARRVPTDADVATISRSDSANASPGVTLPGSGNPAVAERVGDPIVACVFGGGYAGGTPTGLVTDPAWTEVFSSDRFSLYTKTADAADVDNTASYRWDYTSSGPAGVVVTHASWRKWRGSTIGTPSIELTDGDPASVVSPGGRWQLAVIGQRTGSPFPQSEPDQMFVTSEAELVHDAGGNARAGNMKTYISDNVSPVGATFEDLDTAYNVCGLMVVPVS